MTISKEMPFCSFYGNALNAQRCRVILFQLASTPTAEGSLWRSVTASYNNGSNQLQAFNVGIQSEAAISPWRPYLLILLIYLKNRLHFLFHTCLAHLGILRSLQWASSYSVGMHHLKCRRTLLSICVLLNNIFCIINCWSSNEFDF